MSRNYTPERFNLMCWLLSAGLIIIAGSTTALAEDTAGVRQWTPTTAAADLREGGHILFLQHAAGEEFPATVPCQGSSALDDDERTLAMHIGTQFRRLSIPVVRVVSSEFCVAMRTAELLDLAGVEVDADLNPVDLGTVDPVQIERLRRMIGMQAPPDSNILLVSHRTNINRLLNIDTQSLPGVLYSFRRIEGRLSMVGSVKPSEWSNAVGG